MDTDTMGRDEQGGWLLISWTYADSDSDTAMDVDRGGSGTGSDIKY